MCETKWIPAKKSRNKQSHNTLLLNSWFSFSSESGWVWREQKWHRLYSRDHDVWTTTAGQPSFPHPHSFLAFQSGLHAGKIKSSSSRCVGSLFIAMVFFILNVDPSNLISAVFILDSHDKLQKHRCDKCQIIYSSWISNLTHSGRFLAVQASSITYIVCRGQLMIRA